MKKIILAAVSIILICVCAFSMVACNNKLTSLESKFQDYNVWQERVKPGKPEILEYDVMKGDEIVGSYKTEVNRSNENSPYYIYKSGIFASSQGSEATYTFTLPSNSYELKQTLTLFDGSFSMETVAYMTSRYCISGSYSKITKDNKTDITLAHNIDGEKYYFTKYYSDGSVKDGKIKVDSFKVEGYYDNTMFYFLLRSIPADYAGYQFNLIDVDNKTTNKITTTMDVKDDFITITAKTTHELLGDYQEYVCKVENNSNRIVVEIVEGDYRYVLKK